MTSELRDQRLKERYIAYLASPAFRPVLKRLHPRPLWRLVLALVAFLCPPFGIPIGVYQLIQAFRHGKLKRTEMIEAAWRSVPIMTYPLIANTSLSREPGAIAPALVVGSFQPQANESVEFMATLCVRILEIDLEGPKNPDEEAIVRLMADENYIPNRRRRLPDSLTRGREVYAFDLMIVGEFLPGGTLESPMIPCVAEPGPVGRIAMIPAQVVGEALSGPVLKG